MTDSKRKKQDKGSGGVSTVAAAVTGIAVGAGVAVAGAIALSNKKNQEKLKGFVRGIQKQVGSKKEEIEKEVAKGKEKLTKTADTVLDAKKEVKKTWQK